MINQGDIDDMFQSIYTTIKTNKQYNRIIKV